MKHNDIKIGQTVYHDFSGTKGEVTGKRLKKPFTICVLWDDGSFREDWYKPEVLTDVEGGKTDE